MIRLINSLKAVFTIFAFLFACSSISSQNCGRVLDFTVEESSNGNGTVNTTFHVTIEATSGGSKSVNLTIKCPNIIFVQNQCVESMSITRVVTFGPYTTSPCSGPAELIWTGHTNATCGGTSCSGATVSASPLPVELSHFGSSVEGGTVRLNWTTQSELNNEKFLVQRQTEGRDFETIGEVEGALTTAESRNYDFIDGKPVPGTSYYRLKQVDTDGQFQFSTVISVTLDRPVAVRVYPTATSDQVYVEDPENGITSVEVFDAKGALLISGNYPRVASAVVSFEYLEPGMYIVRVRTGREAHVQRVRKM